MAEPIFWTSFVFIAYIYFGYPVLLILWRRLARRTVRKAYWEPSVSLVIAAHNERDNIERKIANCLDSDYPRDRMQIIVSLDAPTDGTESLAQRYANRREVEIIYSRLRKGKVAAINAAVKKAEGQILVFGDARQRLDTNAIRELVANFQDSSVGAVTGELILLDENGKEANDGIGVYWRYEKWLRAMEVEIHSMIGATGAIYAIRRELFKELPEDTILDDVAIPLRALLAGKRTIFDPAARAYDVECTPEMEYRRKVRTLMGNYQLLAQMPELLLPSRNPLFMQFLSHKVGRLFVPYFLAALFLANLFLLSGFYLVFFVLQITWYFLACVGSIVSSQSHRHMPHALAVGTSEKRA
ncbi:MAG TPA: glycosyltransferase family 2 protein [Acidobacteriota bacterium]|jgi:cellulose synthase/poly-beta-1,6-N-acetylglucosamine synthase-like glycosyltransferase